MYDCDRRQEEVALIERGRQTGVTSDRGAQPVRVEIAVVGAFEDVEAMTVDRPKILVVNDSPDFLTFMREFLTLEGGYDVATLDQSEGIIEQVTSAPPDMLIIDIVFRGNFTGFSIAEQLASAAETAGIPVLFCTALFEREVPDHVRDQMIQRGQRILHKPFDVDDLLTHIEQMIPRLQLS